MVAGSRFVGPALALQCWDSKATVVRSRLFQATALPFLRDDIFNLVTISHDCD